MNLRYALPQCVRLQRASLSVNGGRHTTQLIRTSGHSLRPISSRVMARSYDLFVSSNGRPEKRAMNSSMIHPLVRQRVQATLDSDSTKHVALWRDAMGSGYLLTRPFS